MDRHALTPVLGCHVRPFRIRPMAVAPHPYLAAKRRQLVPPRAYSSRMAAAFSTVNTASPFRSPKTCPPRARPFSHLSRLLSRTVPRKRWSGRIQGGLSQWWSTHSPSGIAPRASVHAYRCARQFLPFRRISPYPRALTAPVQTQHPSGDTVTFGQNRITSPPPPTADHRPSAPLPAPSLLPVPPARA